MAEIDDQFEEEIAPTEQTLSERVRLAMTNMGVDMRGLSRIHEPGSMGNLVMFNLRDGIDIKHPEGKTIGNFCDPSWLTGTARIVFDECQRSGLNPVVTYNFDHQGEDAWFDLEITK